MRPFFQSALALALGLAALPAAGADGRRAVYIPTGDAAEVLILDPRTRAPAGRISGLPAAHGLAITPDGTRLIVGSFDERAPGEAMPEKPAGVSAADHAAHHAADPAGYSAESISTVSIVDLKSRSIERRIDVPGAVHHVAASPDGRLAAVTHPNRGQVTVIELSGPTVLGTVKTGSTPNYAAFSPDASRLFVTNAGDDDLAVVDMATLTVSNRIALGNTPEHLVLSADGSRGFVNNVGDGTVSIVDLAENRVVETLSFGAALHGIDLSPDGRTLFVAVRGDDRIAAVDLQSGVQRSVSVSPQPYHLGMIGETGELYVSCGEESVIWVLDPGTLEIVARIPLPGIGHQFAEDPAS